MEDKEIVENLPRQEKLGAPAAGVEGTTVPGAPTSSSYEGLTAVSTAGTAVELATAERVSDPAEAAEDLFLGRPSWLDEVNSELGSEEMETQEEAASKKRKADVSPVISISSGEDVVAPPYSLRGSRKCRIVDSPEEDKIDLTRLSETPIRSDDASGADTGAGAAGSFGGNKKGVSVGYRTKRSLVQVTPPTPKIDLKPELDDISYDELIGMGVIDAGTVGLECTGVMDAVRIKSKRLQGPLNGALKNKIRKVNDVIKALIEKGEASGDPMLWETKAKKLADELAVTKKDLDNSKRENVTLKRDKEELWNEITKLRIEMKKIDDLKSENGSLWKAINEMKTDMRRLSRERSPEGLNMGKSDLKARLTFRDEVSPVAGPSRMSAVSGTPLAITPIPENKEETKLHMSAMIGNLKKVRRQEKGQDRDEAGLDMSWEQMEQKESPLPQRQPRSSRPRIIANVQLAPPREEAKPDMDRHPSSLVKGNESKARSKKNESRLKIKKGDDHESQWTEVASKKGKKNKKGKGTGLAEEQGKIEPESTPSVRNDKKKKTQGKTTVKLARMPSKTAVVSITGRTDDFSYRDALTAAREKISLTDLKIEKTRLRRAANGGYLIEIMDSGCYEKARALQDKLRAILPEEKASVTRPMKSGELRFIGLDVTATNEEVAAVIMEYGKCEKEDIRVGDIQAMRNGLYTAWARCPLAVAALIARKRKIRIGWTYVRVEMLGARPVQCFRCWGFGHLRYSCNSSTDRSRACFNCGEEGHSFRACTQASRCVTCEMEGRKSDHRLGSVSCKVDKNPKRPRSTVVAPSRRTGDNTDAGFDAQSPTVQC